MTKRTAATAGFMASLILCCVVAATLHALEKIPPRIVRDDDDHYVEFTTGSTRYILKKSAITSVSFPLSPPDKGQRTAIQVGSITVYTDWTENEFNVFTGNLIEHESPSH